LVRNARIETGKTQQLTALFLHLQEAVPYPIIRLCLAYLEREEKEAGVN